MPGKPFRIVHLSDLHLTADDDARRVEPRFAAHLTGMNKNFRAVIGRKTIQEADLVLITGDVTDDGDLRSWHHLHQALLDAGILARTRIIIGNHDVCWLGSPDGLLHRLLGADLKRAIQGLRLCKQPARYPWAERVEPRIALFALDTNNSGNPSPLTNAVGRVGYFQLLAFADLLHTYRDAPIKVVMVHHSPNIPQRATALRRGRRPVDLLTRWLHQIPREDRRALRLLCRTHRVRLILHGHLHSAEDRLVGGVRIVGAPATTEPIDRAKRPSEFQFCSYTVLPGSGRIIRRLETVTV